MLFVQPQELATCRQIIIHHVEDLPIYTFLNSRQYDSLSAVIDIGEWEPIGAPEMKKNSKCVEPDPSSNLTLTRTEHYPWAQDDIGHTIFFGVFKDQLILF